MMKNFNKQLILYILSGIVLCIFVTLPYFKQGFFPTHDGEWAVVRAAEMFRELRDFQFPPRYSGALNFGYGYPLFNFAYPAPYYVTTVFHALSLSFTESVKALFVISTFISFFSMFALSFYFWKSKVAGFLSAALYLFLPYRLVDLYVRGSVGETMAFALYPIILLCMLLIMDPKKRNTGVLGVSIGIGILALTHNISAVYFGFIIGAFAVALIYLRKYKEVLYLFLSVAWGGFLSSFFVFPALYERQYIKLSKIPIADRSLYFVTLPKLFVPSWGYGTPTDSNPFPYTLGISQSVGYVMAIWACLKTKDVNKAIIVSFIILVFVMVLMMFPAFGFMWKLPLLSEINYPWTLLLPLGFLMSFLSGIVVKINKGGLYVGVLVLLLAVIFTYSYTKPQMFVDRGDEYYITNEATTTSSLELMPTWVSRIPQQRFNEKIKLDGEVNNLLYSSNKITFETFSSSSGLLTVNQIYYPGWKAFVNNQEVEIFYNNPTGVMSLKVPAGSNNIRLYFSETALRRFFDIISLSSAVSLFGFGLLIVFKKIAQEPNVHKKRK